MTPVVRALLFALEGRQCRLVVVMERESVWCGGSIPCVFGLFVGAVWLDPFT